MSDPLTWSPISLGRWFGTAVRVHILLILFVRDPARLVGGHPGRGRPALLSRQTAAWLGLFLMALAVHELGHAATAAWLDCDQDEVHLWPLGNLVGPSFVPRSGEHFLVALAGPFASGAFFLVTAIGLSLFAGAQVVWCPFGNHGTEAGTPWITRCGGQAAEPGLDARLVRLLNWVLLLANLIPALPFDGGRVLRALLGSTSLVSSRDNPSAFYAARAFAMILGFAGLFGCWSVGERDGWTLIVMALVIEYMVRVEARMLEEGGFFDDGVFGYDFSEGYTSLEGGAAKVRPHREGALKRWRRRRSELRRERRMAREAAEERRMDEILEKLYREGRAALSDEENRFLVRVSARYRNRTKNT